ncbi:MAG: primosomal protein N' [Acidobacteria bacterium]|nr:primosomal protein N' [Acidobacteriota bacterium]MYA47002.1 primosomal protein N' [Acidobacteriota bacterium]MYI40259.1 primosomal protein N' [Acidobacteriota bacterium]
MPRSAVPSDLNRVEVAVPRPVPGTYTYEAPRALLRPGETTLPPGTRVRVPFGPGELTGVVLGPGAPAPAAGGQQKKVVLKTVRSRFDDPLPPLPEDLLALAGRLAEATVCPLGLVLKAMLPASAPPGRVLRTATITAEGSARLREPDDRTANRPGGALPRLSEDDRRILTLLAVSRGPVPLVRIRRELELSPGRSFARLEREGFLVTGAERLTPDAASPGDPADQAPSRPPPLTAPQREAAAVLREALAARAFGAFLLDGVTGSGKTEVYFQAIAACLETGRSALLLVPEIALASQQEALLRARFGRGIAVFHSGLGAAERRAAFWRIRRGEARIVLGARSAVLAPIRDLGLVILDEEHDAAYKQDEAPRYHARQAAWFRARAAGAVMVLGSATPSLEAAHAAERKAFTRLRLPHRIAGRALPDVEIVDMRPLLRAYYKDPARDRGRGPLILAPTLETALRETVAAGRQALVLLNRRGYGGRMGCLRCGEIIECRRCGVAFTLHRRGSLAVCHGCGIGMAPPEACPACGGDVLRSEGFGTERVEEVVSRLLPDVPVARFDRDTTRARGSHAQTLDAFREGAIRVLVGTQMIAKGHDFPAVTLVGVVAADGGLGAPDFRAAERTFQLLTQVAGRAGRGEDPGRVVIQTMKPDHYAVSAAARQDYPAFAAVEAEMRRRFRYPPFVRLTSLTVSARSSRKAEEAASALARNIVTPDAPESIEIVGPAPAPGPRPEGSWRWQMLVRAAPTEHPALRRRLRRLLESPALARGLTINDDP